MPSTSARSDPGTPVRFYDGVSAVRRAPLLVVAGDGFTLVEDDRVDGPFAFADLTGQGSYDGHAQFGLKRRPGWRIDVATPVPAALAAHLPREGRYGGAIDRIGLWPGVLVCAGLAALAIFGLSRTPTLAAHLLPRSVERVIGDAMVGDFGNRTCATPAGDAALRTLVARLGPDAALADIRVVNVGIVNAVTLPGGHVLVFDELVQNARSPDEVAGVIAHELGHVAHRDVVASLIRQLGLSVVLGGIGGDVGGWVNSLLAAGYSRSAEAAADDYAIDMLRDGHVSPVGVSDFFGRLAKVDMMPQRARNMLGYLASHPLSDDRRRRFAASAKDHRGDTPALTPIEWAALRRICKDDPDVAKTEFRF